jgi:hypothetical protein
MRLVRSLPDSELYLTVRELGPYDALPLLALASHEQLTHVLDLESWRRDRFDAKRCGAWVALLVEAGEPTVRRLLRSSDDELLSLLFQRWVGVQPVDFDKDGGPELHSVHKPETGDERGLVSPDGAYRFSPSIPEHASAVQRLAQILFQSQRTRYDRILWSAVYELPADLEEQTLRWRQSRLEEHGFPPWDEALSVYAPPAGLRTHPRPLPPKDHDGLQASRAPLRLLAEDDLLPRLLQQLLPDARDRALHELISVANRLIVADAADTGDPETHRVTLRTAAGYIELALEARGFDDEPGAASLLAEVPLIELFREGYAQAAQLQRVATALVQEGWASAHSDALALLDSPLRDRIERLLDRRPNYLELLEDGRFAARPFRKLREIEETRVALELAQLVGRLMVEQLGLDVERAVEDGRAAQTEPPRLSTYFLTLLAWHSSRGVLRGDPLPLEVFADFLRQVASRRTAPAQAAEQALGRLIGELEPAFELRGPETAMLRSFGRAALERLSAECGALDPGAPPSAGSVGCLLLEAREKP